MLFLLTRVIKVCLTEAEVRPACCVFTGDSGSQSPASSPGTRHPACTRHPARSGLRVEVGAWGINTDAGALVPPPAVSCQPLLSGPGASSLLPAAGKLAGPLLSRQVGRIYHVSQLLAICSRLSILYEWKFFFTNVSD